MKKNKLLLTILILFCIIIVQFVLNLNEGVEDYDYTKQNSHCYKSNKSNISGFNSSCLDKIVFDSSSFKTDCNGLLTPTSYYNYKRCIMQSIHNSIFRYYFFQNINISWQIQFVHTYPSQERCAHLFYKNNEVAL